MKDEAENPYKRLIGIVEWPTKPRIMHRHQYPKMNNEMARFGMVHHNSFC